MSAPIVRNVFPVVSAVVGTLYLVVAAPQGFIPDAMAAPAPAQAEVQRCMAGGRDTDACLDEADAKALIEDADQAARDDVRDRRASR